MNRFAAASRGFTLVEVLVALVIVAFGAGALMSTLTSAADNIGHLRDKSFAEWIALNQISEQRLALARPSTGEASGDVEFAGQRWRWQRVVTDQGVADMLRMEVTVSRLGTGEGEQPALATAWGFIGRAVAPASGSDPDWSPQAAPAPGGEDDDRDGGGVTNPTNPYGPTNSGASQ
jgi:general secretion pathway protein I